MPTFAGIEDRTAFIRTSQLHGGESDLVAAALLARLVGDGLGLDLVSLDSLDDGKLLSEQGRKIGGLALGYDDFGGDVLRRSRHS